MPPDERSSRPGVGLVLSPPAAPLAIWAGLLVRALIAPTRANDPTFNPVAIVVLALALLAYGAPLAYAATLGFLWPVFRVLESIDRADWWWMALAGAVAGSLLFPVYLKLLDAHGFFSFFPGAGAVAGATNAVAFWYIATRRPPKQR